MQVPIGKKIRCFKCREYDHFVRYCPTAQAEQIEQMFNMDKDQTLLQMPLIDRDQVRQSISITEARENLGLQKVRMVPPHFVFRFKIRWRD